MDLEKRLRDAQPVITKDLSHLNASVLATLLEEQSPVPVARHNLLRVVSSFLRAFVQYPLPMLTASSLLISLVLLQLGSTFGFSDWLMQQAGSIVFR